jgi:hypothetical protein
MDDNYSMPYLDWSAHAAPGFLPHSLLYMLYVTMVVTTGVAPFGAARVPDRTRWARGDDWTTAGEGKLSSPVLAVGTCFTYALELW